MYHLDVHYCPSCHTRLDGCDSPTTDRRPEPNDITLCAYCGMLLTWNEDMTFRMLTIEEIKDFPLKTLLDIARAQQAIREMAALRALRN